MFYRLVSDYGFGDVTWLNRHLTAEQAAEEWNSVMGSYGRRNQITAADVLNMINGGEYDSVYRIEEDDDEDIEPDTFLDS
jgi:hypothetical protein